MFVQLIQRDIQTTKSKAVQEEKYDRVCGKLQSQCYIQSHHVPVHVQVTSNGFGLAADRNDKSVSKVWRDQASMGL